MSIAAREERKRRRRGREGGEEKRSGKGGRWGEETRDGRSTSREKNGRMELVYIYILHTHSMTDLHAIVVNSFVF